jgi:UDP-glucose 4-epimerase
MTWLVTGGAGYIGAHVVRSLVQDGAEVVVLDDLSTGQRSRVDPAAAFVQGSVLDRALVRNALREHGVTGVVHIAAKKQVGESMADPLLYYRENVEGMIALLEACRSSGVDKLVFSSSAATYGLPDVELVDEDTPGVPLSPYGETKLIGEWVLRHCERAYAMRAVSLRYFNVAGAATPELGDTGVFNLIPMVFQRLEAGERPRVFGGDYPTPDGTCVRDYVHVADIADAHRVAARALEDGAPGATYNIGRGEGSSVLDVLRVVGEVTGRDTTPEVVERRPGDPARVVAAVDRIRERLGFSAQHGLRSMVESAWAGWQLQHPAG